MSDHIGRMPFLWLAVPDAPGKRSDRAYLEANAIGLLSSYQRMTIDSPSPVWLGRWADAPKVRESGLWNVDHVDHTYDPGFLDLLEARVSGTTGRRDPVSTGFRAQSRSASAVWPAPVPAGRPQGEEAMSLATDGDRMLLHEAILQVLGDGEMTCSEIADALNRTGIYRKRDGSRIAPSQVSARIRRPQYAPLFCLNRTVSPQRVRARRHR